MRILSVAHALPDTVLTNDDIVQRLEREARIASWSEDDIRRLTHEARQGFALTGTKERRVCSEDERPIDLLQHASDLVFQRTGVNPSEVDFLIYSGVARGWLEPSMAAVCQRLLGTLNANCFDILEACASWLRALQVAHLLIQSGTHRVGLICNCEAGLLPFARFRFDTPDQLSRHFAAFTCGEAATATLVRANSDKSDDFYFKFASIGKHFDLCMIPLDRYADYLPAGMELSATPGKFFSIPGRLTSVTVKNALRMFREDPVLSEGRYDAVFGHQVSVKVSQLVIERLGLTGATFVPTHERYGNVVSASVPLGMSLSLAEDKWHRGDRTIVIVGSSGVSIGMCSFTF